MPEFVLQDAAGKELRLSSLKGKRVLINLWATWCRPCVSEMPQLNAIAAEGQLRVLTVSQNGESESAKVAAFMKERGLDRLEPWLDPQSDLAFHYGGGNLPMSILYDANAREVWRFAGERDWSSAESREQLGLR